MRTPTSINNSLWKYLGSLACISLVCACGEETAAFEQSGDKADVIDIEVTLTTKKTMYNLNESIEVELLNKTYTLIYVSDCPMFRVERFKDGQWVEEPGQQGTCKTARVERKKSLNKTWSPKEKGLYRISDTIGIFCQPDLPINASNCQNAITMRSKTIVVGFAAQRWACDELDLWLQAECAMESDDRSEYQICFEDTPAGDQWEAAEECCADANKPWCGGPSCIRIASAKILGLEDDETVFEIDGCTKEQRDDDIKDFLLNKDGYQFEWFGMSDSTLNEALALLKTDHRDGDGTKPYSAQAIEKINSFYNSAEASKKIELGEYADSYMSGTGITGLVGLFSADEKKMILLTKFIYAE